MTEVADRHPARKRSGWVSKLLTLPFATAGVILVSILFSVLVEWVGIYCQWWEQPGDAHARATLASELGWLSTEFTRSALVSEPVAMARQALEYAYDTVILQSGIGPWLAQYADDHGWMGTVYTYVMAAVHVALTILVRVIILILTSPLFLLAGLVGIVDGLVRRDLRRFGAGRESAFIYHHAKRLTGPIFVTGWLLYLSLPGSVHPNVFLLPCAALFGLTLSITVGSFKKYL